MSRGLYIAIFLSIGFLFLVIASVMYKKTKAFALNSDKKTKKNKIYRDNTLVVLTFIVAACVFSLALMERIGYRYAAVGKYIFILPALALFNNIRNRGRKRFFYGLTILVLLYVFLIYMFVDLPIKAPAISIYDTKIIMNETTVRELKDKGFDIYIQQYLDPMSSYDEVLSGGEYEKYPQDESIFLDAGFDTMTGRLLYPQYILVKNGVAVGEVGLYGDLYSTKALEDCKIVYFKLDRELINLVKENSIPMKFNRVSILRPLESEVMNKTFGKKMGEGPKVSPYSDERYYDIKWTTRSDYTFWDEYFAEIYYDTNNEMTLFELTTEVARDIKE